MDLCNSRIFKIFFTASVLCIFLVCLVSPLLFLTGLVILILMLTGLGVYEDSASYQKVRQHRQAMKRMREQWPQEFDVILIETRQARQFLGDP